MSEVSEAAARRAARLLRWYPSDWRSRYGDEFAELLIADISERPDSWRRHADVAISGVLARLIPTGLTGHAIDPAEQVRASLASLGYLLGVFLSLGIALWAQLTIGWQWSKPDTAAISVAMILMSGAVLLLCGLALLAAIPIACAVILRFVRRQPDGLILPALFFVAGSAVLVIGGRHFGNGWPGTGGHPWSHPGLVPGGVAAFTWASTLWVSSCWAHPGSLALFPAAELAWTGRTLTSPATSSRKCFGTVGGHIRRENPGQLEGRQRSWDRRASSRSCRRPTASAAGESAFRGEVCAGQGAQARAQQVDDLLRARGGEFVRVEQVP